MPGKYHSRGWTPSPNGQQPTPSPCRLLPFPVQDGVTTTLDGLRSGDAGEPIPRSSVQSAALFTNDLLP